MAVSLLKVRFNGDLSTLAALMGRGVTPSPAALAGSEIRKRHPGIDAGVPCEKGSLDGDRPRPSSPSHMERQLRRPHSHPLLGDAEFLPQRSHQRRALLRIL